VTARARRVPRAAAGIRMAVSVAVVLAAAVACASYSDALARGQRYYEDNQYERALALWRDLDRRGAELSPSERARYAYFRGMTDYRLGYRDDARHWLAIAWATDGTHPGGLGTTWLERLDSALTDLGREPARAGGEGADLVQTIEAPPGAGSTDDPAGSGLDSSGPEGPAAGAGGVGGISGAPAEAAPSGWPAAQGSSSETPVVDAGTSPAP